MSQANAAMVERFWDSINRRDVDGYLATFAENAVAYDPVTGPPLSTADDRRAFMQGLLGSFSDLAAQIDFMVPCGDSTAAKWTVRAKTLDGQDVTIEGIDVYHHGADGRFTEMHGYFQA